MRDEEKERRKRNVSHGRFLTDFIKTPDYIEACLIISKHINECFGFSDMYDKMAPEFLPYRPLKNSSERELFGLFSKLEETSLVFETLYGSLEHDYIDTPPGQKKKIENEIKSDWEKIEKVRRDFVSKERFAEIGKIYELASEYITSFISYDDLFSHQRRIKTIFNDFLNERCIDHTISEYLREYEKITCRLSITAQNLIIEKQFFEERAFYLENRGSSKFISFCLINFLRDSYSKKLLRKCERCQEYFTATRDHKDWKYCPICSRKSSLSKERSAELQRERRTRLRQEKESKTLENKIATFMKYTPTSTREEAQEYIKADTEL